MKWALLAVACVSLLVCWQLGQPLSHFKSGTADPGVSLIFLTVASPSIVGMVMAGLIGLTSVLRAARVQISENKKKD